jgi:neutral ceramidase
VCFCGQSTPFGPLADHAVFGASYLTGSEEGRGPLFDATGDIYEGRRLAAPMGVQGVKDPARSDDNRTLEPTSVPLTAARLGDRLIVTIPGEATTELGRRTRAAALAATRAFGIRRVVVAGYANEYASYFTTPEEYGAQHYEGGTTVYGPASGPFLTASLADLAGRLVHGQPAPAPHPFDPIRGLEPTAAPYPPGAARARPLRQPTPLAARLARASFRWRGGAAGMDRPLDRAFVSVERLDRGRWRAADTDLGLRILWRVDDDKPKVSGVPRFQRGEGGDYTAWWEPDRATPTGHYRFVVSARRYRLVSRSFRVRPADNLIAELERAAGSVTVRLAYPPAGSELDFTARPPRAASGRATLRVNGHHVSVRIHGGSGTVSAPASADVSVAPGAARDRFGNVNGPVPGR